MKRIMKRKALLLLVVAICLCNDVMTQDESHTFLKSLLSEDRVWTMSYSSIYQKDQVSCIESKLEGDTIIGNISFKRKYNREWKQNEGGSREWKATDYYVGQIGGKVYYYYKALYEEPQLLLDFSAKVGDDIPYNVDGRPGSLNVVNVSDTVLTSSTDQRLMRSVYVRDVESGVSDVWIEGIGSLEYGIEPYFMNRITGTIPKLLKCAEGDNVLYEHPDAAIITSVSSPSVQYEVSNSAIYNLQGQRLSTPPAKGLYIQNGRKIMVK